MPSRFAVLLLAPTLLGCAPGASTEVREEACQIADGAAAPDSLAHLGCRRDFDALSSAPLDTSLPGAQSVKIVMDLLGGPTLHFQNSKKYQIHYQFASAHLSGGGLPLVGTLSQFNQTEYYRPDRRFVLGAVTYYSGPGVWALEIAPYDTASATMIEALYTAVEREAYFGPALSFHPTSAAVQAEARGLPASVPVKTTDELYAAIDYQPLNLATAVGQLTFVKAADLATAYLSPRSIVVLDRVPNDISVVQGLITEEFQTPLSHVNVLAQNRKTPNMGLRGATKSEKLLALAGKWVKLTVGAAAWSVEEASPAEAEAYWEAHRPPKVTLPAADLSVKALTNIEDVTPEGMGTLRDALRKAVLAFGGKAAQYSILARTAGLPVRKAFAIPASYYVQFMEDNGLYRQLDALLADPAFVGQQSVRDKKLAELRAAMMKAPVNAEFQTLLKAKLQAEYPSLDMRFRTSTNSEDLEGFPCAGCYESHTGDADDWEDVLDAIRETWASIFLFRTFEERSYYSVDHKAVVMALLVHHNFQGEMANGVALTGNPFDPSGLQPGFYVNVQAGGSAEVVHPPPGVTSDEFLYQFDQPGQPVIYLGHSNIVEEGKTVLSAAQIFQLGKALSAIHARFSPAYGPAAGNMGWYAMDVEFKFEGVGQAAQLFIKQARPSPGRGD